MSQVFGGGAYAGAWLPSPPYQIYAKLSSIRISSKTFVFIEEHPNSINDGAFAVNMANDLADTSVKIVDFPASHHAGSGELAMADGHVEIHRWLGSKIKPPINLVLAQTGATVAENVPAGDSVADIRWLSDNTTTK